MLLLEVKEIEQDAWVQEVAVLDSSRLPHFKEEHLISGMPIRIGLFTVALNEADYINYILMDVIA